MTSALDAYKAFDKREPGWIKVALEPEAAPRPDVRRTTEDGPVLIA